MSSFDPNSIQELFIHDVDPGTVSKFKEAAETQPAVVKAFFTYVQAHPEKAVDNPNLVSEMKKRFVEGTVEGDPVLKSRISVGSDSSEEGGDPVEVSEPLSGLLALDDKAWEARPIEHLNQALTDYSETHTPSGRQAEHAGFLVRLDVDEGTDLAVVGDIHGDDCRLVATLGKLQQRGFLDSEYRCLPGKQLIFLGDYVDRGKNSLTVLELLVALKDENPEQVHLIRGNHEDVKQVNRNLTQYAGNKETKYRKYLTQKSNQQILTQFYESLPVAVYVGQKSETGEREYVQFCHGLFHLYTDPQPLFETRSEKALLWVKGENEFSHRVMQLKSPPGEGASAEEKKLYQSAAKISHLASKMKVRFDDIYWLDAGKRPGIVEMGGGRVHIGPDLVEAYLATSSTSDVRITEIIRGHQHGQWTVMGSEKRDVVTTIDPSDVPNKQYYYELKVSALTEKWKRDFIHFSF